MVGFPLRTLRLLPGEEQVEHAALAIEPLALGGQEYSFGADALETTLTLQRATSGFVLRLRFDVAVHGPCMRCLEQAVVPLAVDVREYHDLDPAGDEDLVSDYVRDDVVELEPWARDAIVLGLPDPVLCTPDCAGLCPVCGVNLNHEPHAHDEASLDPRWSALEGLALEE